MRTIRFGSTRLADKGKKGILAPDVDGYRTMILGGLNAYNSAGEYYTLDGAIDLFKNSSSLMRRLDRGVLKAELGHPKKTPGMTDDEFLNRVLSIDERNVTAHIKELWLDHEFGRKNPQFKNPKLVAVMGKICPSGPFSTALEASLNNPSENVTFSIRGLTNNYYERGQTYRVLTTIVTFDNVTEQGINIANKWDAPALESLDDFTIHKYQLERLVEENNPIALESSREIAREALSAVKPSELPRIPLYAKW